MCLTVGDKMLLHLGRFDYLTYSKEYEVPYDVTQDGCAIALHISRAHVSLELKKLREKGYARQMLAHVKGGPVNRNAYFLTERGMIARSESVKKMEKDGLTLDMLFADRTTFGFVPSCEIAMAYNNIMDAVNKVAVLRDDRRPNVGPVINVLLDAVKMLSEYQSRIVDKVPVRYVEKKQKDWGPLLKPFSLFSTAVLA